MTDGQHGSRDDAGQTKPVVDLSLQDRVADAAAEFDRCFAAAAAQAGPRQFDSLRAAADRLMRACARVLIELGQSEDESP